MASRTQEKPAEKTPVIEGAEGIDVALVTTAPDDWEFETVVDRVPTQIEFTTIGDQFVGQYLRKDHITPDPSTKVEPFDLLIFEARDGNPYSISPTYKLEAAIEEKKLKPNDWVRLRYVADIETRRGLNPMKDIMVEIRKA